MAGSGDSRCVIGGRGTGRAPAGGRGTGRGRAGGAGTGRVASDAVRGASKSVADCMSAVAVPGVSGGCASVTDLSARLDAGCAVAGFLSRFGRGMGTDWTSPADRTTTFDIR